MSKLFIAILIGAAAGVIDIIPMLIQRLNKYATISAFLHWVAAGIVIAYLQVPMAPWLTGLIFGELLAIPVAVMVAKDDRKSVPIILGMSTMLGTLIGIAVSFCIG